jgi:chemotaxis protein histidine kinase CheA
MNKNLLKFLSLGLSSLTAAFSNFSKADAIKKPDVADEKKTDAEDTDKNRKFRKRKIVPYIAAGAATLLTFVLCCSSKELKEPGELPVNPTPKELKKAEADKADEAEEEEEVTEWSAQESGENSSEFNELLQQEIKSVSEERARIAKRSLDDTAWEQEGKAEINKFLSQSGVERAKEEGCKIEDSIAVLALNDIILLASKFIHPANLKEFVENLSEEAIYTKTCKTAVAMHWVFLKDSDFKFLEFFVYLAGNKNFSPFKIDANGKNAICYSMERNMKNPKNKTKTRLLKLFLLHARANLTKNEFIRQLNSPCNKKTGQRPIDIAKIVKDESLKDMLIDFGANEKAAESAEGLGEIEIIRRAFYRGGVFLQEASKKLDSISKDDLKRTSILAALRLNADLGNKQSQELLEEFGIKCGGEIKKLSDEQIKEWKKHGLKRTHPNSDYCPFYCSNTDRRGWKIHVSPKPEYAGKVFGILKETLGDGSESGKDWKVYVDISKYQEENSSRPSSIQSFSQRAKFAAIYPKNDEEARWMADTLAQKFKENGLNEECFFDIFGDFYVGNGIYARLCHYKDKDGSDRGIPLINAKTFNEHAKSMKASVQKYEHPFKEIRIYDMKLPKNVSELKQKLDPNLKYIAEVFEISIKGIN